MNLTFVKEVFYSECDMYPKDDELSPDLVWMLSSDQVADETLIDALVQRYYQHIYRQALSQLVYPEEATRTAQETFVQAVIESHHYRGTIPVDEWLDEIASRIRDERETILQEQQLLNSQLILSIHKSKKSDSLSPPDLDLARHNIRIEVRARKRSGTKRISAQVLGLLAMITLVVVVMLSSRDYWSPQPILENPPSQIDPGGEQVSGKKITAKQEIDQESPVETIEPSEPLTLNSTSDEIEDRIQTSNQYWETLWAEILVTFHGPEGYLGPPIYERHQFWIDPQLGGMLVSGPVGRFPNSIERFSIPSEYGSGDWIWRESSEYAQIGSRMPWFTLNLETVINLPYVLNYLSFSAISDEIHTVRYNPVGEQVWAGHQVLIVDLVLDSGFVMAQILLDPETGIKLQEKYFDRASNGRAIIESKLKELRFNQPMPVMWERDDTGLLSPPNLVPGNNIEEYDAISESDTNALGWLPDDIAPINFDPARSRLTYFSVYPLDANQDGTSAYSLFADDYYIGDIDLINPLQMICTRSPSGNRIAFANWTYYLFEEISTVFWFDLDDLELIKHEIPEMALHWIGFSPDDNLLAISGYSETSGNNRFFIIDTNTGTLQTLPIHARFNRIAWSPDGNQILVLEEAGSSFDREAERSINVYSAFDGQLVDQLKVEAVPSGLNSFSFRLEDGEIEFGLALQDISSCVAPPRN